MLINNYLDIVHSKSIVFFLYKQKYFRQSTVVVKKGEENILLDIWKEKNRSFTHVDEQHSSLIHHHH